MNTWWISALQYATSTLSLILIFRLLLLREKREGVYSVFAFFLAFQLVPSAAYLILSRWFPGKVDYRLLWLAISVVYWTFSLALVYSLAKAVLAELPGLLRFSRILLNCVFPLAIILALSTASGEYSITGAAKLPDSVDRMVAIGFVLDRAISMAALLILAAILAFILWFPVKMPRNLAIFCVGLVVYFGSKTGLALLRTYFAPGLSRQSTEVVSASMTIVLVLCFVYWIIFMDAKGQTAEVRLGHSWRVADQRRLLNQLESLNGALLRNSERMQL